LKDDGIGKSIDATHAWWMFYFYTADLFLQQTENPTGLIKLLTGLGKSLLTFVLWLAFLAPVS
jgi:hypothetical protein